MKETSASEPLVKHRNGLVTSKPEFHHCSGKSMVGTYLLAMRCPVCRRRDFHSGFVRNLGTWPMMLREKVQAATPRG